MEILLNVASLEKKENSLLNNYKKLIALRNSEPSLQYGKYKQLSFLNDVIAFTRTFNGDTIKCYFNFGENPKKIALEKNENILLGELTMQPNTYLIIK